MISFINSEGIEEPGIDGGGLFKEFVEELVKTAFDPDFGLFVSIDNSDADDKTENATNNTDNTLPYFPKK